MLQCATTLCAGRAGRRGRPARPGPPAGGAGHARLRRLDLDVVRERDARARRTIASASIVAADRRELRHVRREEPRHVDDGRAVRPVRVDVEHRR